MNARSAGKTDIGLKRKVNEDSFLIASDLGLHLMADGMGGHKAGEVASRMVVDILQDYWRKVRKGVPPPFLKPIELDLPQVARHLVNSISMANSLVYEAQKRPEYERMGSTITALLMDEDCFWVANVGDSRLYLYDRGRLIQITEDHSLAAEQASLGLLDPGKLSSSFHRNVLTRVLGLEEGVDVFITSIKPEVGDVILMCTDGLTNYVTEQVIRTVLDDFSISLERKVDVLIEEAKRGGGGDNISVILLEIEKKGVWEGLKKKLRL